MEIRHALGLDLGKINDYTAVSIVEWIRDVPPYKVNVRHLQRFPLGTSYPVVVDQVEDMLRRPPLRGQCDLVIDATGVGRPVVDLFQKRGLDPIGVTITGGTDVIHEGRDWKVPKRDLVSSVQVGLQSRTLRVARDLPEAETLVNELLNFQVKITAAANDTYGAWREGTHDDLVLAVALTCWWVSVAPGPAVFW
jgi:hypothetical protein